MRAAQALVDEVAHNDGHHTYGVNTGFGRFVSREIPEELTAELQLRLLRSHACGVGEPYPREIVRAALLLRANALAKGYSGTRVETAELLLECLNRGVLPSVPSRGSVGASGDLAPLAHLALPLVGEGEAEVDGEVLPGAEALARAGLAPIRLEAKEGLSLINGTQFMAAFGALGVVRARRLAAAADIACALSLEALQGSQVAFGPQVQALRPLPGQAASRRKRARACSRARRSWRPTAGATRCRTRTRCAAHPRCTAPRATCSPMSRRTVGVELNAATDNPLVLVESGELVSNGNFHGQPLAFALDALAMAVSELASISERRVERLVNPALSDGLPPFLTSRRRPQLRLHDPAVRRRRPRQRVQVALPSGERRLDPDERGPGGPRLDGERGRAEGLAGAGERRARARDRAARGRAGRRVPRAARVPARGVRAAHDFVRGVSPRLRDDRPLTRTSRRSRARSATARCWMRSRPR